MNFKKFVSAGLLSLMVIGASAGVASAAEEETVEVSTVSLDQDLYASSTGEIADDIEELPPFMQGPATVIADAVGNTIGTVARFLIKISSIADGFR